MKKHRHELQRYGADIVICRAHFTWIALPNDQTHLYYLRTEVGLNERKNYKKKERNHAFDQEKGMIQEEERKHTFDKEKQLESGQERKTTR